MNQAWLKIKRQSKFFERLFLAKIYVYCGTFINPIDRLLLLFKRALLLVKWVTVGWTVGER
jgi:hypothetical protein